MKLPHVMDLFNLCLIPFRKKESHRNREGRRRALSNRDRGTVETVRFTVSTVPRFTVPRFGRGTVKPWATVWLHGSTVEPWNRGPRFGSAVPRLNRGTVGHGLAPRFRG